MFNGDYVTRLKRDMKIIGFIVLFVALNCPAQETTIGTQKAWYIKGSTSPGTGFSGFLHRKKVYFKFKKKYNSDPESQDLNYKEANYFMAYIVNNSDQDLLLNIQDRSLQMIQEAQDSNGVWKPIEYWLFSWCGNSYFEFNLEPKTRLAVPIVKYRGDFKTKIRLKLLTTSGFLFSGSFRGSIPYTQFEKISIDTLSDGVFWSRPEYFD